MSKVLSTGVRRAIVRHAVPLVALIAIVFAYHAPILLSGTTYYSDDILYQHFPSFVFAARRLRAGEFPLWNPHQFSGFPYLADSISQLLYPPLWLLLLLGPRSIMFYVLFHYFVAGLTFYMAAPSLNISSGKARLTASIVFVLGGFLLLHTSNLVNVCAYAWIPLAVSFAAKAAERPSVATGVGLGAVLAIQVLSGGVQIALGTLYLTIIYALTTIASRKLKEDVGWMSLLSQVAQLALGGTIGMCLAAAQILPTWEFTQHSVRAQGLSYEWASSYSLAPSRLLSLLVPSMWPEPRNWTEAARVGDGRIGYAGAVTLAVFVFSGLIANHKKRLRFFLPASFGFLTLSMGRYGFLHRFAYYALPGFQLLRTPVRYLGLYLFCISVVGGLVLDWLRTADRTLTLPLALATVALLTVVLVASVIVRPRSWLDVAMLPAVSLGLFAISVLAFYRGIIPRWALELAFLGLALAELLTFGWRHHLPTAPKDVFDLGPLQAAGTWIESKQTDDYFRVYWPNDLEVQEGNVTYEARAPLATIWSIHGVDGYSQLKPRVYDRLWDELPMTRTLELLNTRYVVGQTEDAPSQRRPVFEDEQITVLLTDAYLPRAFIVDQSRVVQLQEAFSILRRTSFDASKEALLSDCPPYPVRPWPPEAHGYVEITNYSPELIELSAYLPYRGVLVLSEPYYPGWRCEVDGHAVEIQRANAILRAVVLPAGAHEVTFTYAPASVGIGAIVSAIALLLSILFLVGGT